MPMHPESNVEIAEITKIAENSHRYLQISFAEDLYPEHASTLSDLVERLKPSLEQLPVRKAYRVAKFKV
jgi:hypothetical protein